MDIGRLWRAPKPWRRLPRPTPTLNPVCLGTLMGGLAAIGRDKLTLFFSPELRRWAVDRAARRRCNRQGRTRDCSCGGRAACAPSGYRADRLFVVVRLRGGSPAATAEQLEAITTAGIQSTKSNWVTSTMSRRVLSLGVCHLVAASLLEVNPFGEPETIEARQATTRLLDAIGRPASFPARSARWMQPTAPS